jgi:tripartite-type tricarboxylate transporter receptor subunit TctC
MNSLIGRVGKIIIPVLLAIALIPASIGAKEVFPSKPIQIIVPFPPGGSTDQSARIISSKLEPVLNQKVIVVNKPGGGGTTGTAWITQQKPDGYTLLLAAPGPLTSRTIVEKVPYTYEDFDYVAYHCFHEELLAVRADPRWKTFEEFVEDAKRNPGKYSYSTSGAGAMGHILMEVVKYTFKIDLTHVPFKGGAPALTALLGGHVDVLASEAVEAHLKAKTIRKIFSGLSSKNRTESGAKNFEDFGHNIVIEGFNGLALPKGTPKEIIKKLEEACLTVCADAGFKEMIHNTGAIPVAIGSEGFAQKVKDDYALFKATLDRLGLSVK